MKIVPKFSVWFLPKVFNTRYRLASMTRKHRTFGRIVERTMFDEDEVVVLPKDSVAKDINVDIGFDSAGDRTILPSDIVNEMIARADDIFVMNFCICRKSNKCQDYPVDHGCMFMGKGVHRIPEEYGRLVTKEEARAYVAECRELGLVHIIGRNKLDSIWLSTGDKRDLMTVCNCCPCCCLWNMVRDISGDIAGMYRKMDGVSVTVDTERCVGCGLCADICFTKAITIEGGRSSIGDKCRGCGRCADICPSEAITVNFDSSAVDAEMERIADLVRLHNE